MKESKYVHMEAMDAQCCPSGDCSATNGVPQECGLDCASSDGTQAQIQQVRHHGRGRRVRSA